MDSFKNETDEQLKNIKDAFILRDEFLDSIEDIKSKIEKQEQKMGHFTETAEKISGEMRDKLESKMESNERKFKGEIRRLVEMIKRKVKVDD